ncbi:MAG: hypothetical protein AAFX94_24665, partial [Myxococcota bacterium]
MTTALLSALALATADDAPEDPDGLFVFEPAIELGVLWHRAPEIAAGTTFRTSLDFRFGRVSAPFIRVAYDASTARFTRADGEGFERLEANLALLDIIAGPGLRFGPDALQFEATVQAGVQIADTPIPRQLEDDSFVVESESKTVGVGVAGLGVELYLDPEIALTAEFSGRSRFSRLAP